MVERYDLDKNPEPPRYVVAASDYDALAAELKATRDAAVDNLREMQARIRKLKAALLELAELGEQGMKPDYKKWLTFHDKVAKVARAALAGSAVETKAEPQSECLCAPGRIAGFCPVHGIAPSDGGQRE